MQFQMWKYRLNTTGYKWWKGRSNFFTSIPATSLYLLFLIYFSCFITLYMYIINSNFVLNWKVLKKERRILLYILCTNFICCRGGSRGAWAPPQARNYFVSIDFYEQVNKFSTQAPSYEILDPPLCWTCWMSLIYYLIQREGLSRDLTWDEPKMHIVFFL